MTKQSLIDAIAAKSGLTKADSSRALEAFMSTVAETLKKGDKISLTGFGTFGTTKRAAREGRNPRTKEPIPIPAATVPVFKAGKELKEKVNK